MARSTEPAGAFALAAGLVAWSATAGFTIPGRRHPVVQAGLGTTLALALGARPGVRGGRLRSGLELGTASAAVVCAGVAMGVAVPAIREAMVQRDLPQPVWQWLAVDIPLGTVWAEEMLYRGALGTLAADAFGPRLGRLVQAAAFGLSHIADARATGESIVGTVLVTGIAGWLFAVLAERSGSLIAPALTHLAVNESGAVAALLVQRRKIKAPQV